MRRSAAARTAMTSWAPGLLVLAALLAGGCGGEGGPAGELDRVDRLLDWTADTVATLGGAAAPAWAAFQEVTGVAVDGQGRIYLLDGPQRRLVVTDSTGRFRGSVGARGEGPGEFRAPTRLGVADDGSVHVYDAAHGALLVFGPDARAGADATHGPVLRLERARIDAMGFHDVIPVIRAMAVDPEGRIWVQRHPGEPGVPGPVDVVDASGRYLGTLPPGGPGIPDAFGPGGLMAVVSADAVGAPVIHLLRLRTNGPPR